MAIVSSEEIRSFLIGGSMSVVSDSLNTTIIGGTTSTGLGRNPFAFRLSHSTNQWRAVKLIPPADYMTTNDDEHGNNNDNNNNNNRNDQQPVWPPFHEDAPIASLVYRDQLLVFGGRMSTNNISSNKRKSARSSRRGTTTTIQHQHDDDDGVDWSSAHQNQSRPNTSNNNKNGHNNNNNNSGIHNCVLVTPLSGWKADAGPDKAIERLSKATPLHEPSGNNSSNNNNVNNSSSSPSQQHSDLAGFIGASAAFVCSKIEDFGLSSLPGLPITCLQACCDDDSGIAFLLCECLPDPDASNDEEEDETTTANNNTTTQNQTSTTYGETTTYSDDSRYSDDSFLDTSSDDDSYSSPIKNNNKSSPTANTKKPKRTGVVNKKSRNNASSAGRKRKISRKLFNNGEGGYCIHILDLRSRTCITAGSPLTLPEGLSFPSVTSKIVCSMAFDQKARTLFLHSNTQYEKLFLLPLPPAVFARDGDIVPSTNNQVDRVMAKATKGISSSAHTITPQTIDSDDVAKLLDEGRLSNWLSVELGDAPLDTATSTLFVNTASSQAVSESMGNYLAGGNYNNNNTSDNNKNARPETAPINNHNNNKNNNSTNNAGQKLLMPPPGSASGIRNAIRRGSPPKAHHNNTNQSSNTALVTASSSPSKSGSESNNKGPSTSLILVSSDSTVRYDFSALTLIDELLQDVRNGGGDDDDIDSQKSDDEKQKDDDNDKDEKKEKKEVATKSAPKRKYLDDDNVMFPSRGNTSDGIKGVVSSMEDDDEDDEYADDEFDDDKNSVNNSATNDPDVDQQRQKGKNNKKQQQLSSSSFNLKRSWLIKISENRLLFFGGPFPTLRDMKVIKKGEKQWSDFYATTYTAPPAHFTQQLSRLPKRLSPERNKPGTAHSSSSMTAGRPSTSSTLNTKEFPKVQLRSRSLVDQQHQQDSSSSYGVAYAARPPTSSKKSGNNQNTSGGGPGSRPATTSSYSQALVPVGNQHHHQVGAANKNNNNNNAKKNTSSAVHTADENLPAHRSTLSRMMLRVEPTEEKMITRSRVKTLLRGGQLSDDALQDLARTFTDRTTADNMLESGHDEPIRVDCAVDAQHPHSSTVSIEGKTLPVDVHVLSSYATNEDDTTIVTHWLDAQRLISVQLVQHVRVGEARKKELNDLQHELRDEKRDVARQRTELHVEKERLLEIGDDLEQRASNLDTRERDIEAQLRDLDDSKLQHEREVDNFQEQKEAFEAEKLRHAEIEKEHERRRRLEAERQRSHERSMEAELRRQEILNDQLQRQQEGQKAAALKLEKETEKIMREREQFKRDLTILREREQSWLQEQRQFESNISQLGQEIKDRQATNDQLHKQLKDALRAENNTREELETAVRVIEYFDGRRPTETDAEWQKRKEERRNKNEVASKGVFTAKTNVATVNSPFQLHTNTSRSVVAHVRDASHSTQVLPTVSVVAESAFSVKANSYIEVEIGEGFCLGDVIFVNPSVLQRGPPNLATEANNRDSSSSPFSSFRGRSTMSRQNSDDDDDHHHKNNSNNNASSSSVDGNNTTSWYITNPKGIKIAQCMFDPQRRDLDALRFLLMPSSSADLTYSTIETVLRNVMFHTPTHTFTGTRTIEFSVFVVSARILPPGAHCWMEVDVVVIDQPILPQKRPNPFHERGKAVSVMGHCKPVNPFASWMSDAEQTKFAEEHAFFGTKGYNMAKLMNGAAPPSSYAKIADDSSTSDQSPLSRANSGAGARRNSGSARAVVGFLGDEPELITSGELNSSATALRRSSTKNISEEEFFKDVDEESSIVLASPEASQDFTATAPSSSQHLKPPVDASLRRLSPPSLEAYLSEKGPLSVRRCPTCTQMRRLPRFVIKGKDKDVVSQYAVEAVGTSSTNQHNSNIVKTSTGNAAYYLADAIESASSMPEQWSDSTFVFTLEKIQTEDCLVLADNSDVKRAKGNDDLTIELNKAKDTLTITICTGRGASAGMLLSILHSAQFKSTASPLASAPRKITLACNFPNIIIPTTFSKTVEIPIINSPYFVEVKNKRSKWTYFYNSVGIPDAKFDPAPLFFAEHVTVHDELGLKFEGRVQCKIESPALRRDQLRLAVNPSLEKDGFTVVIKDSKALENEENASDSRSNSLTGGSGGAAAATSNRRRTSSFTGGNNNNNNNNGSSSMNRAVSFTNPFSGEKIHQAANSGSNNNKGRSMSIAASRRKSKIVGRELESLFDSAGHIIVNDIHVCDYEIIDYGCVIRLKFHRVTTIALAQAALRCIVFETVDHTSGHRNLILTTNLGRGNLQKTTFEIEVRPGILAIGRMGSVKWVENQPPTLATSQIALVDPKKTPQQFVLHVSISNGYEKGDLLDVRPVLKNARSTTIALPGKAGAPSVIFGGKNRNAEVLSGWRLLDSVYFFLMRDNSLVFVFQKEDGARGRRAGGMSRQAREEDEKRKAEQAALENSILEKDPFAHIPHQRPEKVLKVLGNISYIHTSKSPKNLKKVLRVRSEDRHGIYGDCYLPVNVVPIDDPTDVNNVAWRTLFIQGSYEAQRGLQIAPEAELDDPDTDDFVGGFLSIEPTGKVSVRDELYILPVAEQVRRMLDGIVYVDDRNRVFVFEDEEEYNQYKLELAKETEQGANPSETITQCCVGVMRSIKMPDGMNPVVDGDQFVNAIDDGSGGGSGGAADLNSTAVAAVAMSSGGEIHKAGAPGSTSGSFTATKIEFCFTPAEPRLIPLEDVQAVLRAVAFRNDSTRISNHRRHYMIRLGAGIVNIESNSYEDAMDQSMIKKNALTLVGGESDESGQSDADGAGEEDEINLQVADHTQVPLSIKIIPGVVHVPPIARHHRYVRNTPAIFPGRASMVLPLSRHIDLTRATLIVRVVSERDANSPPPASVPNAQLVTAAMSLHRSMSTQRIKRSASDVSGDDNNSPPSSANHRGASPGSPGSSGGPNESFNRRPSFSNILGDYLTESIYGEEESIHFNPSKASGVELSNGSKVLGFQGTKSIANLVSLTPTALMFQFENSMDSKHLQNILRNISYTAVATNQDAKLPNRSILLSFDLYDAFSYPKNPKYDEREDTDVDPDMSEYPEPGPEDIQAQEDQRRQEKEERRRLKKEAKLKKRDEETRKLAAYQEARLKADPSLADMPANQSTKVFGASPEGKLGTAAENEDDVGEEKYDNDGFDDLDEDELDTPPPEGSAEAKAQAERQQHQQQQQQQLLNQSSTFTDDSDDDDNEQERPLRSKVFEYNTVFSTAIAIHVVDPDAAKAISSGNTPSNPSTSFSASSTTTAHLSSLIAAGVHVPTQIIVGASGGSEFPTDNYFLTMNFLPPNPPAEYIAKSQPSPIFRFAQMSWNSTDPKQQGRASTVILGPPAALILSLPQSSSGHLTVFEDPLLRCAKTDMRHNYKIAACTVEPEEVSLVTDRAAHQANQPSAGNIRLSKAEQEQLDEEAAFARAVRSASPFRASTDAWDTSKRSMSYANLLEAVANEAAANHENKMNGLGHNEDGTNSQSGHLPATGAEIMPMLSAAGRTGRDNGQFAAGETRELRWRGYTVALFTPPAKAGGSLRFDFLSCPASILLEILRHVHYVAGTKDKLRPGSRVNVNMSLKLHPQLLDPQNCGLTVIVSAPIVDDLPTTPTVFSPQDPARCFAAIRVRNVSGFGGGNITVDLECDARMMHKISNKDYVFLDDAAIQNVCTFTIKKKPGNTDTGEIMMTSYQFPAPVVFGTFTLSPHSLHVALGPKSDRNFPPADIVQNFLRHCVLVGSNQDFDSKAPTRADTLSKFMCNLAVEDGSGNTSNGHVVMQAALPKNYTKGAGPRARKVQ